MTLQSPSPSAPGNSQAGVRPARATDGSQAGGQSRGLPQRTRKVGLREFAAWMALVYALGFIGYLLQYAGVIG